MEILATLVIIFTLLQLVVALVNLFFRQKIRYDETPEGRVSVLIPARNEEENIENILSDLQNQSFSDIEILVYDDQSADCTVEKVSAFAGRDARIRLISSEGLPEGWLGKNYACHSLAQKATGRYFLFLDADVRVKGDLISENVTRAERLNAGLVSIFPEQKMKTLGEYLTVPLMKYILLTLLPLILVRKSRFASLSAANGQFMLFNAGSYRALMPHKMMKDKKAEDIEIAQYFKKNKIKTVCLASSRNISCRMYHSFGEAVNGFAKNVNMFFGNSYLLSILFWSITTLGFIAVYLAFGTTMLISYLAGTVLTRVAVSVTGDEPVIMNVLLMPFQQFSLLVIILRSVSLRLKKQYIWKGRRLA